MPEPFADIVEVVEARVGQANMYLAHGYRLLAIQAVTMPVNQHINPAGPTMKRSVVYVMGRPEGVPVYVPPKPDRK